MPHSVEINPRDFRDALGNYPTGVAIITAIDSSGEPAGMVVGTFTSVSLDPPLVGFLPAKSSSSYSQLRTSSAFCVNVLAATQEQLCRQFAVSGADKFAGVSWRPSATGSPRLDGAAAWIDCTVQDVSDAGDHYFVIGRVIDLGARAQCLPLIFFQGGYGQFEPRSFTALPEPDLLRHLHRADIARPTMERLASEYGIECVAIAAVGEELVVVASAGSPAPETRRWQVGQRSPFLPPFGMLFVGADTGYPIGDWLARGGDRLGEVYRQQLREAVERAAQRGWSVSLTNGARERLQREVDRFTEGDRSATELDRIRDLAVETVDLFEPAILESDELYRARLISVPIRDQQGDPVLVLALWGFPSSLSGSEITACAERMLEETKHLSRLMS